MSERWEWIEDGHDDGQLHVKGTNETVIWSSEWLNVRSHFDKLVIAAAPEMLERLEKVLERLDSYWDPEEIDKTKTLLDRIYERKP